MLTDRRPTLSSVSSYFKRGAAAVTNVFVKTIGILSAVPNMQFAMTFSYHGYEPLGKPTDVNFKWLQNLPARDMAGSIYNGLSTFAVSGAFGYKFLSDAADKIYDETQLFREGLNTKRFLTEISMSLLSAITGGSISGDPYEGVSQWIARLIGFVTIGGLSFHGMYDLIIKLTDENYAIKMEIVDRLKHCTPRAQNKIKELLNGEELTAINLSKLLHAIFEFEEAEIQKYIVANQSSKHTVGFEPIFRNASAEEKNTARICSIADQTTASLLALCCNLIYTQSGYDGMNTILGNSLEDLNLSDGAKVGIGILPSVPLTLFAFFTMKFTQSPLIGIFNEIKNDPVELLKLMSLITLCMGNAMWYQGLATSIKNGPNIFGDLLKSNFGDYIFPWAVFLTAFNMGANGLASLVFPTKIHADDPAHVKVIKALESNLVSISPEALQGLKRFSFISGKPVTAPAAETKAAVTFHLDSTLSEADLINPIAIQVKLG